MGRVCFFIPVLDALERPFYAYISMSVKELCALFSDDTPRAVNLAHHAEILHVEEGYWPSEKRQTEIRAFHRPLEDAGVSAVRHYVPAPEVFECA